MLLDNGLMHYKVYLADFSIMQRDIFYLTFLMSLFHKDHLFNSPSRYYLLNIISKQSLQI